MHRDKKSEKRKLKCSSKVEQRTVNARVARSNRARGANNKRK